MNVLWLSCIALTGRDGRMPYPHNGPVAVATTVVNLNIINELIDHHHFNIDLLNTFPIKVFPNGTDLFVAKRMLKINPCFNLNDVSFINLPLVNHVSKGFQLTRLAQRWAIAHPGPGIVFVYSVHSPFLIAAAAAKKLNKDLHICLIVPDLPEFMDIELDKKPIKRLLKKIDAKIIKRSLEQIDSYVPFSKHMGDRLPIKNLPCVVMEGIVNPCDFPPQNSNGKNSENFKIIMYSGSLQSRYGIPNLIQAFMTIPDPDYRLWITGDGSDRKSVESAQKADSRIRYWGFVKDREQVIRMQQDATLLINMRMPSEIQSAYCFPSKLMEYMASGTPVLSYNIQGIPREYGDYLFFLEDENPLGIASKIKEILDLPTGELEQMGKRAREFVLSEKNSRIQTNRILNMIFAAGAQSY
jgi:glycosyltransferase involved in cell wall biosynthesis